MSDADDLRFAQRVLTLMLWDQPDTVPRVVAFVHPGVPVPKERPRFNRTTGTTYTPDKTQRAEEALAWAFVKARGQAVTRALAAVAKKQARPPTQAFHDTVALVVLFFVPTRRRRDADNCLKLVMDAGNRAGIWRDDACVVRVLTCIELDPSQPRTVIALAPCLGTLSTAPLLTASGAI